MKNDKWKLYDIKRLYLENELSYTMRLSTKEMYESVKKEIDFKLTQLEKKYDIK